jgi:hypothetical protein
MAKRDLRMIGRIALAFAGCLSGALGEPSTSGAAPAPVLTASSDTVHVGAVFTIPISIANAAGLTSFQFDLTFDPAIITTLGFADIGTDFDAAASTGGGVLTGITGFVDNTTGLLSGIADSISGLITGNGPTPRGVLVENRVPGLGARHLPAHPVELIPDRQRDAALFGKWRFRAAEWPGDRHRARGCAGAGNARSVGRRIRRIGAAAPLGLTARKTPPYRLTLIKGRGEP